MSPFVYIMLDRDRTPSPAWKSVPIDTKVQVPGGEIVSLEDLLACWKEARYGKRAGSEERDPEHDRRDDRDQGSGAAAAAPVPRTRSRKARKGV